MSGYTQAQIDALRSALARGVRSVSDSEGNTVTYASFNEMRRQLAVMERDVNDPRSGVTDHVYPTFGKGV